MLSEEGLSTAKQQKLVAGRTAGNKFENFKIEAKVMRGSTPLSGHAVPVIHDSLAFPESRVCVKIACLPLVSYCVSNLYRLKNLAVWRRQLPKECQN